ncbi:hypothetical protein H2200_012489 [Cladophialophora chaetospira]|uniref:Thioesterase domain-containing protein n=1 Tax=Cladophialophora chaetospira TaxID=386627 RepID=A0AA38WXY0_9EURO|nr:hypothetical protein H2200_012489 [Cladophialophora chaetospira]
MTSVDISYFEAIPWCATLLKDARWTIITTRSRSQKQNQEDEFFSRTLSTEETIPSCITQVQYADRSHNEQLSAAPGSPPWQPAIIEVRTLFALSAGVNGYPGIAHGGLVSSLLDEVMGLLITTNKDHHEKMLSSTAYEKAGSPTEGQPLRLTTVTAELNIKFRRPILTGGIVLVRAWFETVQGSTINLQATIEDSRGQVLSEGAGRFVGLKPGKEHAFRGGPKPMI